MKTSSFANLYMNKIQLSKNCSFVYVSLKAATLFLMDINFEKAIKGAQMVQKNNNI